MTDRDPTPKVTPLDFEAIFETEEDERARVRQLFDSDLHPYESNGLLVRRFTAKNRWLKNAPELTAQIQSALEADNDESIIDLVGDFNIARELYSPENERPINTVFSYLTLIQAIRDQAGTLDVDYGRVNALGALISKMVADSFSESALPNATDTMKYILERSEDLYEKTKNQLFSSVFSVVSTLAGHTYRRRHAYEYLAIFPDDSTEYSREQVERDTQDISDLFKDMRVTQRYGVKMGYVADPRGGTFIFAPPINQDEVFANFTSPHPLMVQDNSVTQVSHSRKTKHTRLKVKSTQLFEGYSTFGLSDDVDLVIALSIGKDGELYTDRDCRTRLVDIAHGKGKYKAYRDFQAMLLAHYFDITHPLEDVRRAQRAIANTPLSSSPDSPMDSIGRLVIPRVRINETQPEPSTNEVHEDRPTRSVREHGVVWHVRELPDGWQASPDALARAKELGITLKPGETVVREHRRGSRLVGEVTAHHLIERKGTPI